MKLFWPSASPALIHPVGAAEDEDADQSPRPANEGPGTDTTEAEMPTNYAYDPVDGYEGLLLYRLAPRLARRAYPWIATSTTEGLVQFLLAFGGMVGSSPIISTIFPRNLSLVSFVLYLAALQRLALVDLRVMRLLLREFDTLYLAGSMLAGIVASVSPLFRWLPVKLFCLNIGTGAFSTLILDAVRTPRWVTLFIAILHAGIATFWSVFHFFELNPVVADYRARILPNLTYADLFIGRLATLAIYYARFSVRLRFRPGEYVGLKRHVRVRYKGTGHQEGPSDADVDGLTGSMDYTEGLGETEGTLLHSLSPALARAAGLVVSLFAADAVVSLTACAATISTVMLLNGMQLPWLEFGSFLLYVPALQALCMLDVSVLRRLGRYFDFWYLLGNAIAAMVCAFFAFRSRLAATHGVNLMVTALIVISTDALRLRASAKLRNTMVYSTILIAEVVIYSIKGAPDIMNNSRGATARISVVSFWVGRLATLGVFFSKFVVHLVRRPHVFIIINKPLRPDEGVHRLSSTLSRDAELLI